MTAHTHCVYAQNIYTIHTIKCIRVLYLRPTREDVKTYTILWFHLNQFISNFERPKPKSTLFIHTHMQ